MLSLGKNKKCQKHAKNHSTGTLELFCVKTTEENTKYSRNETIFKIGYLAKAQFGLKTKNAKNITETILHEE